MLLGLDTVTLGCQFLWAEICEDFKRTASHSEPLLQWWPSKCLISGTRHIIESLREMWQEINTNTKAKSYWFQWGQDLARELQISILVLVSSSNLRCNLWSFKGTEFSYLKNKETAWQKDGVSNRHLTLLPLSIYKGWNWE